MFGITFFTFTFCYLAHHFPVSILPLKIKIFKWLIKVTVFELIFLSYLLPESIFDKWCEQINSCIRHTPSLYILRLIPVSIVCLMSNKEVLCLPFAYILFPSSWALCIAHNYVCNKRRISEYAIPCTLPKKLLLTIDRSKDKIRKKNVFSKWQCGVSAATRLPPGGDQSI